MVANGYSHMEMFRLSPRDGKALSRLNLFEGQILHGRVYRMEPYGPSGEGSIDRGGIAKISLGSHLIDAAVSKSLPQGARVVLEVVKLADESFILKLISVEEAQTGGGKVAQAQVEPDLIDLSPEALEKIGQAVPRPQANADATVQQKLVELSEIADIPRDAAHVIRAAITQGFIEPADFTASVPTMRVVLHQAVEDFQAMLTNLLAPASASSEVTELIESINALIARIRPMIASLPATVVSANEEVALVAAAFREITGALRPVVQQAAEGTQSTAIVEGEQVSTEAQAASTRISTAGAETIVTNAKPGTATDASQAPGVPKSTPAGQVQPASQQPITPGTLPAGPSASGSTSQSIPGQIYAGPEVKGTSSTDAAAASEQVSGTGDKSAAARVHPARNLLVAMRVLATLAQRMAESRGWTVEQSTELRQHAGRIANSTDALEGALIAPLLGRSIDASDFLPRILFSFLFAGGNADLAVMQPERNGDSGGDYEKEDSEQNRTVGVMRLRTEALGSMRILLDYAETEGVSRVGGRFIASSETAEALRQSISGLDRALDARGLKSEGFRIVGLKTESENNPAPTNRAGGLDLKI